MKFSLVCLTVVSIALALTMSASAREVVLPAGTLLQCTLNEPNFSSATVAVGDPVLCHLHTLTEFGQQAFPRGSYLVGRLEGAKEPGHLFGKGYLKLQFDRIGLPSGDLPLEAKVIATRSYKVDRDGDIRGKGHAKRDVAEWMMPPLWPWKVIMLGARGPRPTLKGESMLTLRLMDDVPLPQVTDQAATFGTRSQLFGQPKNDSLREAPLADGGAQATDLARPTDEMYAMLQTSYPRVASRKVTAPPHAHAIRADELKAILGSAAPGVPVFVLKSGAVLSVSSYTYQDGGLAYSVASGGDGVIGTDEVDWSTTIQLNLQRGVRITLRSGHSIQSASTM